MSNSGLLSTFRDPLEGLLTIVQSRARRAFSDQSFTDRDESTAEAVAAAYQSHARLSARGIKPPVHFLRRIADFAIGHVRDGRHVGGSRTSTDVMAFRAQHLRGFRVMSLNSVRPEPFPEPIRERLADNRRTPVPEQAAFRIDFSKFLATLSDRDQSLARFLALGHSAKDAAARFGLSPARISQLRYRWHREWRRSQDDGRQSLINQTSKTPAMC
jgi:hypothetical protein